MLMRLTKKFNTAGEYVQQIVEMINRFLRYPDDYPKTPCLIVQPQLCVPIIDEPSTTRDCDIYDLNHFITTSKSGKKYPNLRNIVRMARRYFP